MTRALVVIDVQNEYDADAHPDAVLSVVARRESLAAIGAAIDAAHAAGVPVVLVQHGEDPSAPVFATGGPGWQLHEVVASRPHAVVVAKQWPGAFTGTELESWLREGGVDTVAICGYMVQHCVDSTTRQAYHLGFTVELLADATGTLDLTGPDGEVVPAEQVTATVLAVLGSEFARVAPVAQWAAALAAGEALREPSLLDVLRPRVGA
ncbi:MAG: cysteine hydrolase family protein [Kineosporiaceae bacterium]